MFRDAPTKFFTLGGFLSKRFTGELKREARSKGTSSYFPEFEGKDRTQFSLGKSAFQLSTVNKSID